jgi:N-methylhydantoinase A
MTLALADAPLGQADLEALRRRFDAEHQTMFGHSAPEEPVEIVSYRVRGVGLVPAVEMPRFESTGRPLDAALREVRRVRFGGREIDCPVYQRERIDVGVTVAGPAILDQFDATTVLEPGQVAKVDAYKNLIVSTTGT